MSLNIVGRSRGHSVVSKAAYRAGERIFDERLGRSWRHGRKLDTAETFILAPAGSEPWVFDRTRLWNTVERFERRGDAQLALEIRFSLPIELTPQHQVELLQSFLHEQFISRGRVADVCVHRLSSRAHAHVLLTMRALEPDGFGLKQRQWNITPELLKRELHPAWRRAANQALAESTRMTCL